MRSLENFSGAFVKSPCCYLVDVMKAKPVTKCNRDAKIHTIFEGTSEIQQLVIARAISGLRVE